MKGLQNMLNKLSKKFDCFMKKENAYKIISQLSILVIVLSVLSLAYIIDHSGIFNSILLFTFVILNLYFLALAGSLWIFSKFKSIGLMKAIFLKVTALTVSIVGLLIIFQTLGKTQELQMMEVFFLLIGTAIPLTIGKMIWDLTKNIEDEYTINKVDKKRKGVEKNSPKDTFLQMQEYKEEMKEEEIKREDD